VNLPGRAASSSACNGRQAEIERRIQRFPVETSAEAARLIRASEMRRKTNSAI
jgi:hypothetical protein